MADAVGVSKKGEKKKIIFLIIFIIVAIVAVVLWWLNYRKYISTDDANLDTYRIGVSSQVMGQVTRLYVMEGDTVRQGDLLLTLDDSVALARVSQAEAQREQQLAQLASRRVSLVTARKELDIARLTEQLNLENYQRAKAQYERNVIPLEKYQDVEQAWKASKLQTEIARDRFPAVEAELKAAEAAIRAVEATIASARAELGYYRVLAPADGIVGKRWVLPGDMLEAGQTAFTLNRGTDIWVAVYLEETKFKEIYLGQKAQFTLDAYDKLTFEGRVYYIGDNTASELALVPPNNASGNFTKVTQRIPLKISIDKVEGDDGQKARVKLVSGMSATVKIVKE
ncbi:MULTISPECIES: HlyD family secretion protein [Butyricimonas]|uniref:HlyD family secretion protein n=1 Tax=Butyricimonas TaxID=574697 RepID=UPI001D07A89C|nr:MULTISPECIES: HlyD family secretion protein [Butyricimonas]MCB6974042.1 HlyD family secretion protein [Butyricimonas synergistica]MCG4520896.1 HlyD family secretion protein [Butyricimonas sp. DFI.6.44]